MKRFGKLICLIAVVALIAGFALYIDRDDRAVYTSADFPYYNDTTNLVKDADVIVAGTVVKVHPAKDIDISTDKEREAKVTYTVSDIEITEVIKGDVQIGDIIQIKQLGDENTVINEELKNTGYFKKGMENVFFLQSYKSVNPDMPYSTLSPYQGHIGLENGKVKANEYNKLFKSDIDKKALIEEIKTKL